jgi:hypothetical protein
MAAMQDPKIQQIVGMSPMAQQIQAAMTAHINEHVGYEYRKQMQSMMNIPLPSPDSEDQVGIPEEMEIQISQMAAQASQQLLQQNQQEVQAQKNAQMQQDPLIQMQQQELQLKQQDMQLKQQKMAIEAAAKEDQLEIERMRIASQEKIAGMQVGAKVAKDKADLASKDAIEGLRIGSQIAHNKAQLNAQQREKPQKGAEQKGD